MMIRSLLPALGLSLLAAGTAFGDDTHTVVQQGRAFHPGEVTINRGEALTFTNNDEFIHQVYVVGLFDSDEKAPGQNLTESFPEAGTFEVRCHIHPKMKLVVRVK
jgi:plastocyanin